MSKECIWHDATKELPEIDKEVIVIYDNGYLCYNHRPYQEDVLVDEDGWCAFSKSITKGHKVALWTDSPIEEE